VVFAELFLVGQKTVTGLNFAAVYALEKTMDQ